MFSFIPIPGIHICDFLIVTCIMQFIAIKAYHELSQTVWTKKIQNCAVCCVSGRVVHQRVPLGLG